MIVHDKFIIASSTKSGTHSCMALAHATKGMEYIRTNHMMIVPREHQDKDRLFLVRNPYDRMKSIYFHIYRKYTEWGHRYIKNMTFEEFVPWFLDQREEWAWHPKTTTLGAPGVWVRTAYENYSLLMSDDLWPRPESFWFRIEDGLFFDWVVERYGLETKRDEMPHTNRADNFLERENQNREWTESLPDSLEERIWTEWAKMDCEFFGYER